MSILLTLHSLVRWAIVLVALAAIIKFALGLAQKSPYDRAASALSAGFSGLMDTQALLGILFFILTSVSAGNAGPIYRWEHLTTMLAAVVIGHMPSVWKKLDDQKRYRNGLLAILAALLLIAIGVMRLPGNRWLTITGLF